MGFAAATRALAASASLEAPSTPRKKQFSKTSTASAMAVARHSSPCKNKITLTATFAAVETYVSLSKKLTEMMALAAPVGCHLAHPPRLKKHASRPSPDWVEALSAYPRINL